MAETVPGQDKDQDNWGQDVLHHGADQEVSLLHQQRQGFIRGLLQHQLQLLDVRCFKKNKSVCRNRRLFPFIILNRCVDISFIKSDLMIIRVKLAPGWSCLSRFDEDGVTSDQQGPGKVDSDSTPDSPLEDNTGRQRCVQMRIVSG